MMYEMRVRSPPNDFTDPAQYGHAFGGGGRAGSATTSYTSYETAADELWPGDDDDEQRGVLVGSYSPSSERRDFERSSEETTRGVHGVGVGQQHDRRPSVVDVDETWEVGRAL